MGHSRWWVDSFFFLTPIAVPDADDFLVHLETVSDHRDFFRSRLRVDEETFLECDADNLSKDNVTPLSVNDRRHGGVEMNK